MPRLLQTEQLYTIGTDITVHSADILSGRFIEEDLLSVKFQNHFAVPEETE